MTTLTTTEARSSNNQNDLAVDGQDDNTPSVSPSQKKSSSPYPVWHTAVSGGVAGAGSRMVTAPLDLLRIRRQLAPQTQYPRVTLWGQMVQIVQTEGGVTALFRGNLAAIHLWVGYSAVQFALYDKTRRWLSQELHWQNSTAIAFGAGAAAGLCATVATYPFDVCRTTFAARGNVVVVPQVQPPPLPPPTPPASPLPPQQVPFSSLVEPCYQRRPGAAPTATVRVSPPPPPPPSAATFTATAPPKNMTEFTILLYRQRGIAGFYAGAAPAVLQIIPYMGMNFAIYDYLSRENRSVALSGYAGTISGAVSKLMVYPIDTVKRRLQAQAFFSGSHAESAAALHAYDHSRYQGMWDCMRRIFEEEGMLSFYRGAFLSVLKSTIATGMTFFFFRLSKNTLESIHDGSLLDVAATTTSRDATWLGLPKQPTASSLSSSNTDVASRNSSNSR